ncbi:MAG: AAA family ATPase [Methylococcaceae bacterium]|nr:MAG: AAA family ATPase [Methylococcaceae bacterium]
MQKLLDAFFTQANDIILGKTPALKLAMCCLLARGHLLIEDVPGVGKTTLANTLAHLLGLNYQRVQFTSDLLPADILGTTVFDPVKQVFTFHPGAVFTQVLLADEINRTTPKTQSALLEAMEEKQVTIERKTYDLPTPFFVIATQNPLSQIGTYPLPESQLDRFLMCISLGFPDRYAERSLLKGEDRRLLLQSKSICMNPQQLIELQNSVAAVHVSEALLDYLQALIHYTRQSDDYAYGLSPRAGLALLAAARAWAFLNNRSMVLPEDVQAILGAVAGHRLRRAHGIGGSASDSVVAPLLEKVAVP